MNLPIEIPKASKFLRHLAIDEIANEVSNACFHDGGSVSDLIDVEDFIGSELGKELMWEMIQEPENRTCFAALHGNTILLNEKHRSLFQEKPFLLRSCLAHEIGHEVLRHPECFRFDQNQQSLFESKEESGVIFHDSAYRQVSLSRDDYSEIRRRLAKEAVINPSAREMLAGLENRLEPEWMFAQAEQFASCFLLPKDRLFNFLEFGLDITRWPDLYKIANHFEVSISMVCVRLQKLSLIQIDGKLIKLVSKTARMNLL